METVSVLVFFFFLLLLLVAEARSTNRTRCEQFTCGGLDFKFPFFRTDMPSRCGLFKLNCSANITEIHLVDKGKWYQVNSISQAITITITDPTLNQSLITGNCSDLSSSSFPNSPWFYLTTLYECNGSKRTNGFTYAKCRDRGNSSTLGDHQDASECSVIKTPESRVVSRNNVYAIFSLHIDLPRGCLRCRNIGGECTMEKDKYRCVGATTDIHAVLSKKAKIGIGFACGFLGAALLTGCLLCFMIGKRGTSHYPRHHNLKALVQLKEYSYAEVKKITKSFSHTVGKGGFGTVYGGNLCGGRKVAVKILKDFKSNGEDFINEVASMSQTSHVNIVSLLGFCYEGSKRAIVYEFLENGSLDQFLSNKKSLNLDVSTLYRIALGVARGLEYLHHGCKTRIVHFDIKPQNILLDENLCPKVSDFGLAKLCEKRESILSLLDARGTIGYIAPEVFSGMYGRVSHKSDVYSYGMLVLEMIGARNNEAMETAASNSSSAYFPDWIYKNLENGEHTWKFGDEMTREEKEIAKKMTLVGLWCIQPCPLSRPSMNKVVEMMEGSLDALEVPPKPSLNISTVPFPESSSLSYENSNYTEVLICSTG